MTSTVEAPSAGPSAAGRPHERRGVRRDIQGLRAIAVSTVVLYHFWPRRLTGGYVGVDVFFVISGFLIIGHLMARPPARGGDLAAFWGRRVRRLLPAALLVLTVTLVLSRLVAPALQWGATAKEVLAAAFYVENWSLASKAVDYLAADAAPTPVQHFWSLSVEEQFYAVWPLLVLATVLLAGRSLRRQAALLLVVLSAVFAWSLWLSMRTTAAAPAKAYFVTYTRAWEFALGGIVAWLGAALRGRWRGVTADLAAWAGIAAILVATVRFTSATPFPGHTALLPVLGTGLALLAWSEGPLGPRALWRVPGVQWLGDVSYSVYLWHWPLLMLAPFALGTTLKWPTKVALLALVLLLSGLSKTLVEDRYRAPRPGVPLRRTFLVALLGMATVAGLVGLQLTEVSRADAHARAQLDAARTSHDPCFGAGAVVRGAAACPENPHGALVPDLSIAADDKSDAYRNSCFVSGPLTGRKTCTFGHGPTKVALVGNSHAAHWLPALQRLADERGWTITTYLVSICNVSDAGTGMQTETLRRSCADYGRWVFDRTKGHAYDVVLTSERQTTRVPGQTWATTEQASAAGYASYLRRWSASGARVVVIKDVLAPPVALGRIPDCLSKHLDDRASCAWPDRVTQPSAPNAYRWMDPLYDAARSLHDPHVSTVSLDDLICPQGTCQPVIGSVVTFFDASHLTATFARTLAPELGVRLERALGRA